MPDTFNDGFWAYTSGSHAVSAAASSSALYILDKRVGRAADQLTEPTLLYHTDYSASALRRGKITSIATSAVSFEDTPLFAVSTTDHVHYFDRRYASLPVVSWAHRRGYDRTMSLHSIPGPGADGFVLASQRNRLLTTYGVESTEGSVDRYVAQWIPSGVPSTYDTSSPTPPYLADLGGLGGTWTQGTSALLEQTHDGAVWLRYMARPSLLSLDEPLPPIDVPPSTPLPPGPSEAGPFGSTEETPMDFRTLYQAAILGWLGLPQMQAWQAATSARIKAATHAALPVPSTLYVGLLTRLDRIMQQEQPERAGASQAHTEHTLSAEGLYASHEAQTAWKTFLDEAHTSAISLLALSLGSYSDLPTMEDMHRWLERIPSESPCVRAAGRQQALDVCAASICYHGAVPEDRTGVNTNWYWDRKGEPVCPPPPPCWLLPTSDVYNTDLSESARLLMAEWPLAEDPSAYVYRNPYTGLDLPEEAPAVSALPSASQPVRPTVRRASQMPRTRSRRDHGDEPASQDWAPASSQEPLAPLAQTQIEPGRFAQRKASSAAKRPRRVGGF